MLAANDTLASSDFISVHSAISSGAGAIFGARWREVTMAVLNLDYESLYLIALFNFFFILLNNLKFVEARK